MRQVSILLLLSICLACGCTRAFYRRSADRETYDAIAEHSDEKRWPIASADVVPPPASRLFDPFNPDHPPMPPDDPAAQHFMRWPNGIHGSWHYDDDGHAPFIEDPDWLAHLPLNSDGKLELTPERAVELGVINSREYALALENLYLAALALTLNRFEFDCHWFLTNSTLATWFGSGPTENNTLNTTSTFGFTRNLYAGGQLVVDFANNFIFFFSQHGLKIGTSNWFASFTQPLLRGAGRWVRMEPLTQAERTVLYGVRDFARFRKLFYVNATTTRAGGFLALLLQTQTIRNLEADVKSQEQNYRLHEALFQAQTVSTVQVDQAYQSLLQSRLALLQAQTGLESALDQYKISLGLPPRLPVVLDDALLKPFQLVAPELESLQGELDRFFADFRERDAPPSIAELHDGFARLATLHERAGKLLDQAEGELKTWKARLGADADDAAQARRERETYQALESQLPELRTDFAQTGRDIARDAGRVDEQRRRQAWDALQNRTRQVIGALAQLYVLETQARVYLIHLEPVPYKLDEALAYAYENRLDLMNLRGRVVDAWRDIGVAANALKGDLNVQVTGNWATPPFLDHPLDFDASASTYTASVQFSGPLDRVAERNRYRASQIAYQQSRQNFMALEDQIDASIRQDERLLAQERINFSIARLALITAARQVEASRERLLLVANAADTTSTLDILNALNALLQARSALIGIGSWVNYQSDQILLLFDMDALQLTPRGIPPHEPDHEPDPDLLPVPCPIPDGHAE
jgi:outer membrane protein TolC